MSNPVGSGSWNPFKIIAENYLENKLLLCARHESKVKTIREKSFCTAKHIQKINKLSNKYKVESSISSVTAFFLKLLCPEKYDEFMLRNTFAIERVKYINKLASVGSSKVNVDAEVGQPLNRTVENDLISILCDEHVYERMKKFGHRFEEGHEPIFKMKKVDNFQALEKHFPQLCGSLDDKVQFLKERDGLGLEIRIKGNFEDGRYKNVPLNGLSADQIRDLISSHNSKDIEIVNTRNLLTIDELIAEGVIFRDVDTNYLHIVEGYQYLEDGFEYRPDSDWEHMEPIGRVKNPPKEFKLDVLIHRPRSGGAEAQGHASLRITTPSGELYSVGFFPENQKFGEDIEEDPSTLGKYDQDAKIRPGAIQIPDRYIFMPETAFETQEISFDLKGSKNFHQVIEYIQKLKKNPIVEEGAEISADLLFHATHQNCAAFAKEIVEFALENGAERITEKPSLFSLKRAKAAITNFVLSVATTMPGVSKYFKASKGLNGTPYEDLKITELFGRAVLLPADLPYAV